MPDGRTEHDRITDLAIQVDRYAQVTNAELRALRQGQDRLEDGQAQLRTDVTELRTDVTELRTDVNGLRTDVNDLRQGQARLEGRMDRLETGQQQLVDLMNENFRQLFVMLNSRQS